MPVRVFYARTFLQMWYFLQGRIFISSLQQFLTHKIIPRKGITSTKQYPEFIVNIHSSKVQLYTYNWRCSGQKNYYFSTRSYTKWYHFLAELNTYWLTCSVHHSRRKHLCFLRSYTPANHQKEQQQSNYNLPGIIFVRIENFIDN